MKTLAQIAPFALVALELPLLSACGDQAGGQSTATASAKPSAAPIATTKASARASSQPSAEPAASAAPAAAASLSADEFCAQAVALGESNMAKCAKSEKANVAAMAGVKDLAKAKEECQARVASANVELHGDVAARCLDAAKKRGGKTTFFTLFLVPECHGVLTGKLEEGKPAKFAEECASGLALYRNRCAKPGAKNSPCEDNPAGLLGRVEDHARCETGAECFMTQDTADGLPAKFQCMPPSEIGAPCKLDINTCREGASCYQGKCRAVATTGGDCMAARDCGPGLVCDIKGGAFGKCAAGATVEEPCH